MKSLRGKPQSIMFLGFNSLLSQQAAGNLTQERLKLIALNSPVHFTASSIGTMPVIILLKVFAIGT
jgi:hypothetical protein